VVTLSNATSLLDALRAAPDDDALRARAARVLAADGRHAESTDLVAARWRNLTAHLPDDPACLCRKCLAAAPEVHTLDGIRFERAFAVAGGRALWFWWPEGMEARRERAIADVTASLVARFADRATQSDDDAEDDA